MSDASDRWRGAFGKEYTRRNALTEEGVDDLYLRRYGTTRSALNDEFLEGLRIESILEVGCNRGSQLARLGRRSWQERFSGLRLARERRLSYLEDAGLQDAMYLLEKKAAAG